MNLKAHAVQTAGLTDCVALFRMDSDQYARLPESRHKMELLEGEVVMSPSPRPEHQQFIFQLGFPLYQWTRAHGLGELFPETDVRLSDSWTPAPDLSFLKAEHLHRVRPTQIVGPVDLAVEILSPSNPDNDLEVKFAAYARHGIPWYWIVDLDRNRLTEYELVGSAYANPVEVPFDAPFAPRLFPGLTVDLGAPAR